MDGPALLEAITVQGNAVRQAKTDGKSKDEITQEVQKLLKLKADYKSVTGEDPPGPAKGSSKKDKKKKKEAEPAAAKPASATAGEGADILDKIAAQGEAVRKMKTDGKSKQEIGEEVKKLLSLKAEYKAVTGEDPPAPGKGSSKKDKKAKKEEPTKAPEGESKNAKKKKEKEAKKAAAKKEKEKATAPVASAMDIPEGTESYGFAQMNQSKDRPGRTYTVVGDLNASRVGERVLVRGRVETVRKKSSKLVFVVLRQRWTKVQALCSVGENITKEMIKFTSMIPPESVVDLEGEVVAAEVESCTQKDCEIHFDKIFVISKSAVPLPLQLEDASRPEGSEGTVAQDTRLNFRYVDLRTTVNQAIFRIQSGVCMFFREYLLLNGFQEIHTPKIIPAASEGGAEVFSLKYFDTQAFLAQSPQLYKQMSINSDFDRVFEIGPVFRSEDSNTHRHLCEFTGLDLEMAFMEHYHEVLDVMDGLFIHMFTGLQKHFATEIEVIKTQFDREPFQFLIPSLRLEWPDAIAMLREDGQEIGDFEDIDTKTEKRLGALVKAKYGTDFYILDKFPLHIRPFYTMPDPNRPGYSNSYDFMMRGEEIMSGAQRVHDYEFLKKRASELGMDMDTIKDYVESFKFGAFPHGGGGVGMERVAMLFLGVPNIRKTSLFPRDPSRCRP